MYNKEFENTYQFSYDRQLEVGLKMETWIYLHIGYPW